MANMQAPRRQPGRHGKDNWDGRENTTPHAGGMGCAPAEDQARTRPLSAMADSAGSRIHTGSTTQKGLAPECTTDPCVLTHTIAGDSAHAVFA
jgi:hypothetical protein